MTSIPNSATDRNVTNREDFCNSFHSNTIAFLDSSEQARNEAKREFVFPRKEAEARTMALSNTLHPNRKETALKATAGMNGAHHRRCAVQHFPRSHSCSSRSKGNDTFPFLSVSPTTGRVPLASLVACGTRATNSSLRKAVLPRKRKLKVAGERYRKRFRHSVVKFGLVEAIVPREMVETRDEVGLEREYSFMSSDHACNTESQTGIHTNNDIDSVAIFRQLNILKRGGYWEHLQRNGTHDEEGHRECETLPDERWNHSPFRKDENKENLSRANHPNTLIYYQEDDDDEDEHDGNPSSIDPYVGSALAITDKNRTIGNSIVFFVHAITEDGWMCSSQAFCGGNDCDCSDVHNEPSADAESSSGHHHYHKKHQSLLLLHLPSKVAALGRTGMCVRGVDLMKRRDNGALEPHIHLTTSGYGHAFLGDSSLSDPLFGRISL